MSSADNHDIELVDTVDSMRLRPGMYVGSTGPRGMLHVVLEVVSNSLDQVLAGRARRIEVTVHDGRSVTVSDDGPGISLVAGDDGRTFLQRVMTVVHSSPTADDHHPHVHLSLGAGLALVNAFSEEITVTVRNDDGVFRQRFGRGRFVSDLERVSDWDGTSGTEVSWRLDPEIFAEELDFKALQARLGDVAALTAGLDLELRLPAVSTTYPTSLEVASLLPTAEEYGNRPAVEVSFREGVDAVDLAFRWGSSRGGLRVRGFCNFLELKEGGAKESVEAGLCRAFGVDTAIDVAAGLDVVVHVQLLNPELGGPTRTRLDSDAAKTLIADTIARELMRAVGAHEDLAAELQKRAACTRDFAAIDSLVPPVEHESSSRPTYDDIHAVFVAVLSGRRSRRSAADWAEPWAGWKAWADSPDERADADVALQAAIHVLERDYLGRLPTDEELRAGLYVLRRARPSAATDADRDG